MTGLFEAYRQMISLSRPRLAAFLVVLGVLLAVGSKSLAGEGGPTRQRRAPDFSLLDGQDKKVALSDYRGNVVLLQFFQTGCPTCQREAPVLEQLYRDYKDKGVVFVGISHDASGAEAIQAFTEKFEISYPLLVGDLEVAVRYVGITPQRSNFKIPHFFLINREGMIVRDIAPGTDTEFFSDEKRALERILNELLAEPAAGKASPHH